jgi:hypothetical protein
MSVAILSLLEAEQYEATELAERGAGSGRNADLWLYRERTVALLKRYLRLSIEVGRLPSLLGREFFRTRVTSYRMASFENAVIFVHDVEHCLEKLDDFSQKLIAKIVLQEYNARRGGPILELLATNRGAAFSRCLGSTQRDVLARGIARPLGRIGRARARMLSRG